MVFSLLCKLFFVPLYYRGEAGASAHRLPFKKKGDTLSWSFLCHLRNYSYLYVDALVWLLFFKKSMRCAGVCTCAS